MVKRGVASKAVRKYLAENPEAKPKDVAVALKKYKVTANLVSNIKSRMKHGLDAVSIAAVSGMPVAAIRSTVMSKDSAEQLRAAAALIRSCGSVATARATLELADEIVRAARK